MWHLCIAALALAAVAQVVQLADALNDFAEIPGFQASWAWVFAPSIVYLAIGLFVTVSFFWRAAYFTNKVRQAKKPAGATASPTDDALPIDPVARAKAIAIYRNNAWVTFVDALVYLVLVVAGSAFIGLLISNLEAAQPSLLISDSSEMSETDSETSSTETEPVNWSFINASIPLVVVWSVLTLVALIGAWRTNSEYSRARREVGDTEGGGLFGCCFGAQDGTDSNESDDNDGGISYRASAVKEKGVYMATADYQQWPCAFMFTWPLGYGWPDSVLSLLLFAMLPAAILVTLLVASRIDTGAPSLGSTFIVLWIIEGLILVFTLIAAVWMCCCAWMPVAQPRGRAGLMAKTAELFSVAVITILLGVQQILIAVRVDDKDPIDWNVVFVPFYVLFGLMAFASCASGHCCVARADTTGTSDRSKYGQTRQTSAWGLVGSKID